jgi:hypothetical protein
MLPIAVAKNLGFMIIVRLLLYIKSPPLQRESLRDLDMWHDDIISLQSLLYRMGDMFEG